ncbi:MAG TPA: glycine dehydrogenase, partial [Planctomycetaceae bacterium]|nr:glycine dehydrogenase [Planctomycetaceae bacterium]
MAYLFRTPAQQREMLQTIGVPSIDALLQQIPAPLQHRGLLNLPPALTEIELEQYVRKLAADTDGASARTCFLGGGAYEHFIPSVVDEVTGRGEFYTAYTPYQAEASQGSLQAFFEYQSLICELTGMDVSNASLYEGGSAISEAVTMAMRSADRRGNVVLCGGVHPEAVQVVSTHVLHFGTEVRVVPIVNGVTDHAALTKLVDDQTAAIVVQDPNFLGALEDVAAVSALAHQHGALCIVSFDPISLGVLKRPGERGADIAVAEGQSLGIPLQ